jgi:anti-sigma factor RsiW
MSCKRIQELVPLYVESDLPRRKLERVRRHLADCLPCRGQLEAFRASQRWLHSAPVPEVGGARLDQLRRSVWRHIAAQPPRSALTVRVERAWVSLRAFAAQPAAAAAAVFVVVLGSVALSRVGGFGATAVMPSETAPAAALASDEHFLDAPDELDDAEEVAPDRILAQASLEESHDLIDGEMGREVAEEGSAADNGLRIEIQTRDPNVRIIWFTPQEERPGAARN